MWENCKKMKKPIWWFQPVIICSLGWALNHLATLFLLAIIYQLIYISITKYKKPNHPYHCSSVWPSVHHKIFFSLKSPWDYPPTTGVDPTVDSQGSAGKVYHGQAFARKCLQSQHFLKCIHFKFLLYKWPSSYNEWIWISRLFGKSRISWPI